MVCQDNMNAKGVKGGERLNALVGTDGSKCYSPQGLFFLGKLLLKDSDILC